MNDTLTAIGSIRVGHAAIPEGLSGCTVILPEGGAVAGVDVRGGAPGTYGTDTLNPVNLVNRVHGIFFTGGSAFGLSAATGLMKALRERDIGFQTGHGRVPIVAGATIFDLGFNASGNLPGEALSLEAFERATFHPVEEGCVGAGLGATVGKLYGLERAMKSGLGSSCVHGAGGLMVGALMVVNAFGDVVDPLSNEVLAGCRESSESSRLIRADLEIRKLTRLRGFTPVESTVIGAVATNARLNKTQLTKVAQMAHDGLARTVAPAHTLLDGDAIFALSCGSIEDVDVSILGALAAQATAEAVLRAVRKACSLGGLPAHADLNNGPPA
ncbi:MAG: P1 family peptidase [Acidobacteriota bacterium]